MKKLAIASAIALMGMGSAFAQEVVINTPQPQVAGLFQVGNIATIATVDGTTTTTFNTTNTIDNIDGVTTALFGTNGTGGLLNTLSTRTTTTTPTVDGDVVETAGFDISVLSGAINLARVNGAIDISGTNVALSSLANNVSATATATATTSTADAFAIAGAKLSTTVIGAMNSATVEVMGKMTDQSNAIGQQTGLASLAAQDMLTINVGTSPLSSASLTNGLSGPNGTLGNAITADELFSATSTTGQLDMSGLSSDITASTTNKINELQSMAVFNTAINAAALDAGIKVVASVDPNAWFLNPQTGVVNLSNVAMATTAIGAMNSGVTRLGANLSTPTVTVK